MNGKHYTQTQTMQRGRDGSLIHGSWRRAGIKLMAAGACALMAGQLLLPSVALASELEGASDAQVEAAAAPAAPTAVDSAATSTDTTGTTVSASADQTDDVPAAPQGKTQQDNSNASAAQPSTSVVDANNAALSRPTSVSAQESGEQVSDGKIDVPSGGSININKIVRNNYTDAREDRTVDLRDGTAVVEGDYSSLNGENLTFEGLGDLAVRATYDEASDRTTLSVDTSNAQREYEDQLYSTDYVEVDSLMTTTFERSELTYTGFTQGEGGDATLNEIRDDYYTRNHVWVKFRLTVPAAETSAISAITVEGVKTDYAPGEVPRATATVPAADADKYEIAYECWEEMGGSDPADLTPVAYWYSDGSRYPTGAKRITQFEEGRFYMYSVELRLKDGAKLEPGSDITVNGRSMSIYLPTTDGLLIPNAASMLCKPAVETRTIDVVEINGVTVGFKDGDRPVFTGKVPEGASYAYRCEWWDLDGRTGAMSTDFGSFFKNKFETFEGGKTYRYGVYVTTYGDVGNVRYVFGPNTKLKINGRYVNYTRYPGDDSDGSDGTMWVVTDLAITPEAVIAPADPGKPQPGGSEIPATKPSDNSGRKTNDKSGDAAKPQAASDGAKGGSKTETTGDKPSGKPNAGELAATGDDAALTVVAMGVAGATVAAAGLAVSKRRV